MIKTGMQFFRHLHHKPRTFLRPLMLAQTHFGITHAANPEQAQELRSLLKERFPEGPEPMINEVNPALGSHVGPGTVCINYILNEQLPETEKKGLLKWFS